MKTAFMITCLTGLLTTQTCLSSNTSKIITRAHTEIEYAFAKAYTPQNHTATSRLEKSPNVIKVALLLDTSSSMDGLINQAKSQLWELVNELAKARCEDQAPSLNIALYEYGNSGLEANDGYIRQVSAFTEDLDDLSGALFGLTTNGGAEYCGMVIQKSIADLDWGKRDNDLNLIFIAGNEPFTQGPVHYKDAVCDAQERDITINTIHCGDYQEGLRTAWKASADLTDGNYIAIDHDKKTLAIATPYDDRILTKNEAMNATYVAYGTKGRRKAALQKEQDGNAMRLSASNAVDRAVSKSSRLYKNSSWDLVDAAEEAHFDYESLDDNALPNELKGKTEAEIKAYIAAKSEQREALQQEITALNKQRAAYILAKQKEAGEEVLGSALIKAIKTQAQRKNYTWE